MAELPILRWQQIYSALEAAGFVRKSQRGSHLKLRHPDGRTIILPTHYGDVPRGTLRSMLKQAGMTAEELLGLLR